MCPLTDAKWLKVDVIALSSCKDTQTKEHRLKTLLSICVTDARIFDWFRKDNGTSKLCKNIKDQISKKQGCEKQKDICVKHKKKVKYVRNKKNELCDK